MSLERHDLYLACTRPAMRWGVPWEGWALNVFGIGYLGMILGSPLWWLLIAPAHYAMRFATNRNPNFFRELRMWLDARGAVPGGTLWCFGHTGRGGSCA